MHDLSVVLFEPQIPQNTGSIARTCAATRTPLHIVGPHPFEISEKAVRRAGLDYWPWVEIYEHSSWNEYTDRANSPRCWFLETVGERLYHDAEFLPGDSLVFGSETTGIPNEILEAYPREQILKIPIYEPSVRSLNLSNVATLIVYEAIRQIRERSGAAKAGSL